MEMGRKELALVAALALLVAVLGSCARCGGSGQQAQTADEQWILVHVTGKVAEPGVYRLPADARVLDAIEAAGGATTDADLHRLNLAAYAYDGQRIYVPGRPETDGEGGNGQRLININTADSATLQQLPGIGPALAQRIIDYREREGGFGAVEEIMNVSGIGPVTFENIKGLISVD